MSDMFSALMGMQGGVATPQQAPIVQGENPMAGLQGLQPGTVPAATPPPQMAVNPGGGRKVRSLEELLFGFGGNIYG